MSAELIETPPGWLRLWHWATALLFLVLMVTGAGMHFARPGFPLSFACARRLHEAAGILLAVAYLGYLGGLLASGRWRCYLPPRRGLLERWREQVTFYAVGAVRGEAPPPAAAPGRPFNALQASIYCAVAFGLLPALVGTGVAYLFPEAAPARVLGLAGLWPLALAHFGLAVIAVVFLLTHVYAATLGVDARARLRAMTFTARVDGRPTTTPR